MTPREYGREFTKGCADVIIFILVIVAISNLIITLLSPTDDSDFGKFNRSGVAVITDAKTGKQYLVTPKGGIVMRQDGEKE